MHGYETPNLRFSAESAAAVPRRRFVKIDAAGKGLLCGVGEQAVGVSMNACTVANEVLEIADGIVMVEAGATVASGVSVESDATGRAILATTGAANGTSLSGGAVGGLIAVKVR